ncbi:YkvA family protein [Azospirillum sp.]|uniref:YkvA family protein n=1 Tax=Azospirillum sp. TaxID=34012 RepID=UPI002D3FAFDE|nr:YkvA family protein [Azospirillum sp.]HYD67897.1 YkvA family protein [Azospirillum sp.]
MGEVMGTELVVVPPERLEEEERFVRRRFWEKLRANLRRLPFVEHLLAAFYCATDPATPAGAKAILLGALAYFVLPFDGVPDWLLIAGFTDDAAVLMAAIQAVRVNLRPEHYDKARAALEEEQDATA